MISSIIIPKSHKFNWGVVIKSIYQDWGDGRQVYEIEFYAGNMEYDMDVDVNTGRVRDFSSEYHYGYGMQQAPVAGYNAPNGYYYDDDMYDWDDRYDFDDRFDFDDRYDFDYDFDDFFDFD